jgi:hypothetical protein
MVSVKILVRSLNNTAPLQTSYSGASAGGKILLAPRDQRAEIGEFPTQTLQLLLLAL